MIKKEKISYKIRVGNISDLEKIVELEKRNWPPARQVDREEFEKRLKTFSDGFLVLTDDKDDIVGMSTAFLFPEKYSVDKLNSTPSKTVLHDSKGSIYYLHAISVDRDYRGLGLGRKLMEAHEANARKFNCHCVYLIAASSEAKFYEKQGYKRTSEYSPYKDTEMAGFEKSLDRRLALKEVKEDNAKSAEERSG